MPGSVVLTVTVTATPQAPGEAAGKVAAGSPPKPVTVISTCVLGTLWCSTTTLPDAPAAPPRAEAGDKPAPGAAKATKFEFVVDKTYAGVVRTGIAGIFSGARQRTFEARKMPGSDFSEVIRTSNPDMDVEIVATFAPYLDGLCSGELNGRSYLKSSIATRFEPFLALGIVAPSAAKTDFLKSVYVGMEWELLPTLSIGAAVLLRRVDALAGNLQIGSPVNDGAGITTTDYKFGVAVVVTVSSDLFKLQTSTSAGTSGNK